MKVVLNRCFGSFSLSDEACEWLIANKGWRVTEFGKDGNYIPGDDAELVKSDLSFARYHFGPRFRDQEASGLRVNPDLIEAVEALGRKANGRCAELEIVEIPDDVTWWIEGHDGVEHIAEAHQIWP